VIDPVIVGQGQDPCGDDLRLDLPGPFLAMLKCEDKDHVHLLPTWLQH